jgi:hypothetical protein
VVRKLTRYEKRCMEGHIIYLDMLQRGQISNGLGGTIQIPKMRHSRPYDLKSRTSTFNGPIKQKPAEKDPIDGDD